MPTGYTSKIVDGEQSFEDFALSCARNFGACIMQKEDPLDEKPKIHKENYYANKLIGSFDEYNTLKNSSDEHCYREVMSALEKSKQRYENTVQEHIEAAKRIKEMISKVSIWEPPTDEHVGLKKFMLDQLNQTLSHDGDPSYYETRLEEVGGEIKDLTPEKARTILQDQIEKDLKYYKKEADKEEDRNNKRGNWIKDLYKSLGLEI